MNKTIKLPDNRVVTVVSPENAAAAISPSDAEMDYRAREAVKAAIHKAKVCKNLLPNMMLSLNVHILKPLTEKKFMSDKKLYIPKHKFA